MKKQKFPLLLAVAVSLVAATSGTAGPCKSGIDCAPDEFCQKAAGDCDGEGVCKPRPVACIAIWDPVCGCDGKTYSNECFAAGAGTSVDYEGECTAFCTDNSECSEGYYCYKAPGDCDGQGVCSPRPLGCPKIWSPVCGCDGQTYGNECMAAAAGVNVDYEGQCLQSPCDDSSDCDPDYYCYKVVGNCDGTGVCNPRPTQCPLILDPVCGCDGRTYWGGECDAATAGVSVDYEGECLPVCTNNNDCDEDYYCAKPKGDCDGDGLCTIRPEFCLRIWAPVCGCDHTTYGNACEAAGAGVSVRYEGECGPGPTTLMMEPRVVADDLHTGPAGVPSLAILWSEPVIFDANDITITDEYHSPVDFTVSGSNSPIMTIQFHENLLGNKYTVTVADSAYSAATGRPVDGDDDGRAGGGAVIVMEHRMRSDFDSNNLVNLADLALWAENWLAFIE